MKQIQLFIYLFLFCAFVTTAQNTQTVNLSVNKDATVKSNAPDSNFGEEQQLQAAVNNSEEYAQRTLLHFDLDAVAIPENAYIVSVSLKLKGIQHNEPNGSNESILQFLEEEWEETEVNWEGQPFAVQENQIELASQGQSTNNLDIDLTNWFREYHLGANSIDNNGFLLRLLEEDGDAMLSFHSKEADLSANQPILEIVYRIPSPLIISVNPRTIERDMPNEGTIDAQVIQGDGPFNFQWSTNANNTSNSSAIGGFTAGTYSVSITDGN